MTTREFFTHLLELDLTWSVQEVSSEEDARKVEVHIECAETAQFPCPICGRHFPVGDFSPLRTWRHLDICGKATYLYARCPIVCCSEHGEQLIHPPWANGDSPLTLTFEALLLSLAKEFGNVEKAAYFLRLERVHLHQIQRRTAKEAEKVTPPATIERPSTLPARSEPGARQVSLFEQNDMSLSNKGIRAFRNMELEKAVELLQKHRSIYPKGYDVTSRLAVAGFLLRGIQEAQTEPSDHPARLCRLWNSFEEYLKSEHKGGEIYIAEIKAAFFARIVEAVERSSGGIAALPADIPMGYVLLQAGRVEDAIPSIQESIARTPHAAPLYGYLGDAYCLRGDTRIARQCYREACIIDACGIDWPHVRDKDLNELSQELLFVYGSDPNLAAAWLPSHARINRLFERKTVRLHDGLKQIIDDYLAVEKAVLPGGESPLLSAKLFFTGMILCESHESFRFIKKIDLIEVRRMMKRANPELFADFLETIAEV